MAQIEILQRLDDEPGLRVRELAERHRLAPNTVSTLIQQMVSSGLVSRSPDPGDRRAVVVSLTEEGATALRSWLAAHERRLEEALANLTTRDQSRIAAAVPALIRLVVWLEAGDLEVDE